MDISGLPAPLLANWGWQARASCRGTNLELFYHPDGERGRARRERAAAAKAVCAVCPVQQECRELSIATKEPYGTWGGLSETERRERYEIAH